MTEVAKKMRTGYLATATTPSELLLRGGTVVDATGTRRADVRVVDGRVVEVAEGLDAPTSAKILDAGEIGRAHV